MLPVFFLLHEFVENFGFIPLKEAVILCLFYVLATLLVWGIFFLVFRNWSRSALFTLFLMCFYLFFSALHELFKKHLGSTLFSRYSFLMPLFLILFIFLFIFLKRSQESFPNANTNEFRILFNKLFHHEFVLLKDSIIILKDKSKS
jgi:hypothetical protein